MEPDQTESDQAMTISSWTYPGQPVWGLPNEEVSKILSDFVIHYRSGELILHHCLKDEGLLHHHLQLYALIRKYHQLSSCYLPIDSGGLETFLEEEIPRVFPALIRSDSIYLPLYWDYRQIMIENDQLVIYTMFKPQPRMYGSFLAGLDVQLRMISLPISRKVDLQKAVNDEINAYSFAGNSNPQRNVSEAINSMTKLGNQVPAQIVGMIKIVNCLNLMMDYSWPNLTRQFGFLLADWWRHKMVDLT